jgi:hypothetical protein
MALSRTGWQSLLPTAITWLDVFAGVRTKVAAKDREKGTFEEYKEAQVSSSCSFVTYSVDTAAGKVTFHTNRSTYPNNHDTTVVRGYELKGDTLSWRVSPRPDGSNSRYRVAPHRWSRKTRLEFQALQESSSVTASTAGRMSPRRKVWCALLLRSTRAS